MKSNLKRVALAVSLLLAALPTALASEETSTNTYTCGPIGSPSCIIAATPYRDGRKSEVRVFNYYDFYRDKSLPVGTKTPQPMLVVVEWDRYDAIVLDKEAAFAQLATNQMVGGDVATNEKIKPDASAIFKEARQIFLTKQSALRKINAVPNREVDMVSFDFVTDQGTFTILRERADLETGNSDWSKLFKQAQNLNVRLAKIYNF